MVVFERPETFLLLLPATILVYALGRRRPGGSALRRLLTPLLRLTILALVIAAAAGPSRPREMTVPRRLVFLLDLSRSVPEEARSGGLDAFRAVREADPEAEPVLVGFAGRARALPWPVEPADLDALDVGSGDTDIATALAAALARGDPDTFLRVVLATDGHETRGDARPAAEALRLAGAALDIIPLAGPPRPRTPHAPGVLALDVPAEGDANAPVPVRALVDLAASREMTVVLHADGLEVARAVASGAPGTEATITFPPFTLLEGSHMLSAAPLDEPHAGHPRAIRIRPGPRALVIREHAPPGRIEAALKVSGIPVLVVLPADLRKTLKGSGPADVLILESGTSLDPLVASLPELVGALGRGASLVLTDGTRLRTARETPLLPYLPVIPDAPIPPPTPPSPDPPGPDEKPGPGTGLEHVAKEALRVSILLVVDTSGSMRGAKIAMARRAAWEAALTLDARDLIGVIGFAGEPYWVVRPTPAGNRRHISAGLARVMPAGGTDIYEALREAFGEFRRQHVSIRHAILLTDGHSAEAPFRRLVEQATRDRITLSTIAIGRDADTRLLTDLSTVWGRGVFQWAQTPDEIPRYVTDDTRRVIQEGRGKPLAPGASPDDRPTESPPKPSHPEPIPPPEEPPEPIRMATPHPALAGIAADSVPDLGGIAPCRARAATWVALETRAGARPVLAEWRVGLGRVLVLTADLEKPGAEAWRGWEDLARFWAQTVRALAAASGPSAGPTIDTRWTPDEVLVRATNPTGVGHPILAALEGGVSRELSTGDAGVVRAGLARGPEARTVLVEARSDGGGVRAITIEVPARLESEDSTRGADEPGLQALAAAAGGRFAPSPDSPPDGPHRRRSESLARWLLLAAALLLPIDVAARRDPVTRWLAQESNLLRRPVGLC